MLLVIAPASCLWCVFGVFGVRLVCVFVRVDASASPDLTRVLALSEVLDFH